MAGKAGDGDCEDEVCEGEEGECVGGYAHRAGGEEGCVEICHREFHEGVDDSPEDCDGYVDLLQK